MAANPTATTSWTVVYDHAARVLAAKGADDAGEYLAKKASRHVLREPGFWRECTRTAKVALNPGHPITRRTAVSSDGPHNAGSKTEGIPDVHYHRYEYGPGHGGGVEVESHVPGGHVP